MTKPVSSVENLEIEKERDYWRSRALAIQIELTNKLPTILDQAHDIRELFISNEIHGWVDHTISSPDHHTVFVSVAPDKRGSIACTECSFTWAGVWN